MDSSDSRNVKVIKLSDKALREMSDGKVATLGYVTFESGEPTIFTSMHPSTDTRVHELYHAKYSPWTSTRAATKDTMDYSAEDIAFEELSAREFTSKAMNGKNYNVDSVVSHLVSLGFRPTKIFKGIDNAFVRLGYQHYSGKNKAVIWSLIKQEYKNYRRK